MKLDLHIHSHASDGQLPPAGVVQAAIRGGLDVIALTDHDTAAGVAEAWLAARDSPLRVIAGIEVSAREGDTELHILGYHVDPLSPSMVRHHEHAVERREERMRQMVRLLQEMGVGVSFEEVLRAAGPEVVSLGRPHLARALHAGGHTRYYGEAFERYIGNSGPAFVMSDLPSVRQAIDLIHAAGGVAAWAHPPVTVFDREIRRFADWGLDGVECFRPATPDSESLLFETGARDLGLLPTGGSDWHGPHRAKLGEFFVTEAEVGEFLRLRGPGPRAATELPTGDGRH